MDSLVAPRECITTSVEHRGDIAVLAAGGVIDLATAPALQIAIDSSIGEGLVALIIDLSEVTFIASVGLSILGSTRERAGELLRFAVVANHRATRRPIQLTGFDHVFSLWWTVDEAMMDVLGPINK